MNSTHSSHDHFVLKLFNLDGKNVEHFHIRHSDNDVHVSITLSLQEHTCPICGSSTSSIKGYTTKKITHSALNGTHCYISYRARRMLCVACKKTFYEHNPFTFSGMKVSLLTVYNVLSDLKSCNETFTSIAKRHNISTTTAASIFDKHVHVSRNPLPEIMCIDEVYAFKSDHSKYVCVLLDYTSQNIIDLLPDRHKGTLIDYFHHIPKEERLRVKLICIDMWQTYRTVAQVMFPKAKLAVDKFHVIQEFTRHLNQMRVKAMNQFYIRDRKALDKYPIEQRNDIYYKEMMYYLFKKFHWLLYSTDSETLDVNKPKRYNHKLNRYLNYHDILTMILDSDTQLKEVFNFYTRLRLFYMTDSEQSAKLALNQLIDLLHASNIESMNRFANTLTQWKSEIIHSFITIPNTDKRINNAIIENTNKTIKNIKHNSNGFTNWDRFRNRILYAINDNVTFSLYPLNTEKDQVI